MEGSNKTYLGINDTRTEDNVITQDMIFEFKEVFSVFDEAGDGSIRTKDLKKVFNCLGQTPTHKEIDDLLNVFNLGRFQEIVFEDFLKLIEHKMKETNETETYHEVFKLFDKEDTGYISACEIKYMMINLGEKLTDQEVNEMLKCANAEEDDKITYDEFATMMKSFRQT